MSGLANLPLQKLLNGFYLLVAAWVAASYGYASFRIWWSERRRRDR